MSRHARRMCIIPLEITGSEFYSPHAELKERGEATANESRQTPYPKGIFQSNQINCGHHFPLIFAHQITNFAIWHDLRRALDCSSIAARGARDVKGCASWGAAHHWTLQHPPSELAGLFQRKLLRLSEATASIHISSFELGRTQIACPDAAQLM